MEHITTVKWLKGRTMVAQSASGHSVIMDASPDIGGQDLGARPMEMVLMGLGGCTSIDVQTMLEKSRQHITQLDVVISAERAQTVPKIYTNIHVQFVVAGYDVDENKVKRAVSLSAEKYCSVAHMLNKSARVTHGIDIQQLGTTITGSTIA